MRFHDRKIEIFKKAIKTSSIRVQTEQLSLINQTITYNKKNILIDYSWIHFQIPQSVELIRDTAQYERWVELPQPLDFKVYIFNVTNVDEIQQGMQPKVEEIGPYVYSWVAYLKNHFRSINTIPLAVNTERSSTSDLAAIKSALRTSRRWLSISTKKNRGC